MTNCRTLTLQRTGAELLFFVVRGQEDLAVLVEAVNQTFQRIGCGRTHRREDRRPLLKVKTKSNTGGWKLDCRMAETNRRRDWMRKRD
jgi:hypothetical protein